MRSYRAVNNIQAVRSIEVDVDAEIEEDIVCDRLVADAIEMIPYTQADKLALSGVVAGTSVFDSTSNYISYYNGTNWYVPSWISFIGPSDTTQSDIDWASSESSPDGRISRSGTTFTLSDVGIYIVKCSASFVVRSAATQECSILISFNRSTGAQLAASRTQSNYIDSSNTGSNSGINYILNHTDASNLYVFKFSSLNGGSIELTTRTHGYISRIL